MLKLQPSGGFWSPVPHAVIQRNKYYEESGNTLEQYLIITEEECMFFLTMFREKNIPVRQILSVACFANRAFA